MFVWKIIFLPPETIFYLGFTSQATVENFVQHMSGACCSAHNDGFVSTLADFSLADAEVRSNLRRRFEILHRPASLYLYTIRANEQFYNSELTVDHLSQLQPSPFASMENVNIARSNANIQSEYIVPGVIDCSLIKEVEIYTIDENGTISIQSQSNMRYQPGISTAHSGPYTGNDSLSPQNVSMPMVAGHPPVTACALDDDDLDHHFEPFLLYILNNYFDYLIYRRL